MKKLALIFLCSLLMTTTVSSQVISNGGDTIIVITPKQLKETNLVFAEHKKLLVENRLLYTQLSNYKNDNVSLIKIDSMRLNQIEMFKREVEIYEDQLRDLNNQITKNRKTYKIMKFMGIGILLFAIFK